MKKLILIIFSFVFLSSNIFANDKNLNEFNEWLYQSGNDQYINIEQSPGCKKLIQKHGLKVPKVGVFDEPKVKTKVLSKASLDIEDLRDLIILS